MVAFILFLSLILVYMVLIVYIERKIAGFVQDRYGPREVGFKGVGQTVADLLKLLQKEDIVPAAADKKLFLLAPMVIFTAVFAGYAVLPFSPDIIGSGAKVGVLFLITIISIDVVGLIMAGWGSNNKYSLFGAMRSVSQIISYEVPLTLSILSVVMISQTLDLQAISFQQGIWINTYPGQENEVNYLFGLKSLGVNITHHGGILAWNVVRMPLLFGAYIVFFIASLAESNRAPFDIPEAESELVAGFHTEYSGFRWAILFLAEYGMMLLVAFLGIILFFGSWNTPFPNMGFLKLAEWTSGAPGTWAGNLWGGFWLIFKTAAVVFFQIMARWTYPRLRVDQLVYLCWKVLTPVALGILVVAAVWRMWMI